MRLGSHEGRMSWLGRQDGDMDTAVVCRGVHVSIAPGRSWARWRSPADLDVMCEVESLMGSVTGSN
jgi:quercetin dioxygenase-like cupin family protein